MRESGGFWMRHGVLGIGCGVALLLGGTGCGEQDLYAPPHSPVQVIGRLPLPSITEDVSVLEDHAFVAGGQAGLHVVDLSNPAAPALVSTIDTKKYAEAIRTASTAGRGGVLDVAFVVEGTEGITTYDITDPANTYSFQQGTTAVDGNGLFIEVPDDPNRPYSVWLAENWHGIRLFESTPDVPGLLAYNGVFSSTLGYAKGMVVENGYAYVADDELGLVVLDARVRVLGSVKVVASLDTPGNARAVDVADGFAYLADGGNGLVVMQISGGAQPVQVGQIALPGTCRAIVVRDGRAYIAAQDGGVHIVGVEDPANPKLLGTIVTTYSTGISLSNSGLVVVSDRNEGLIVLGGQPAFRDLAPPMRIADLRATALGTRTISLRWMAPGDDFLSGRAASYELRYAPAPITQETWEAATPLPAPPPPSRAGTTEEYCATGLAAGETFHFAIRSSDDAGNRSSISNPVAATTAETNSAPVLSGAGVQPEFGPPGSVFRFEVTYADGDGDDPSRHDLILDGVARPMQIVSGGNDCGALYRFEVELPIGIYSHSFAFDDGQGHPVMTDSMAGPLAGREYFQMGSPPGEPGRDPDETLHTVIFLNAVDFSDHEVTQEEYESLMGENPSRFRGPTLPVESVTWFDAVAYCNARSIAEGLTPVYTISGDQVSWDRNADGFRLPTEAEWEWACRAGSDTALPTGALVEMTCGLDPLLDPIAWYCGNAGAGTHAVKGKEPNAFELYDMAGNVWEWCWDWYGELAAGTVSDPTGPESGMQRVIRGGSWYYYARDCRSASRAPYWPNSKDDIVGFRVVRTRF